VKILLSAINLPNLSKLDRKGVYAHVFMTFVRRRSTATLGSVKLNTDWYWSTGIFHKRHIRRYEEFQLMLVSYFPSFFFWGGEVPPPLCFEVHATQQHQRHATHSSRHIACHWTSAKRGWGGSEWRPTAKFLSRSSITNAASGPWCWCHPIGSNKIWRFGRPYR